MGLLMVSVCDTHREVALVIGSMVIMVWDSGESRSSFPEGDPRPTVGDLFAWISLGSWPLATAAGFFSSLFPFSFSFPAPSPVSLACLLFFGF